MAGTTVQDHREVENCFFTAAHQSDLRTTRERLNSFMGYPKRLVFETLWAEQLGSTQHPDFTIAVNVSYNLFRDILEAHYRTQPVRPTEGALEAFAWVREHGANIGMTTGFYRTVTDIILGRLGWKDSGVVDFVCASDEAPSGRPFPDQIQKVMAHFGITDPEQVVNIGDTPSDLQSGRAAGCALALGVTNGTHTFEELTAYPNDGLLPSMLAFPAFVGERMARVMG